MTRRTATDPKTGFIGVLFVASFAIVRPLMAMFSAEITLPRPSGCWELSVMGESRRWRRESDEVLDEEGDLTVIEPVMLIVKNTFYSPVIVRGPLSSIHRLTASVMVYRRPYLPPGLVPPIATSGCVTLEAPIKPLGYGVLVSCRWSSAHNTSEWTCYASAERLAPRASLRNPVFALASLTARFPIAHD